MRIDGPHVHRNLALYVVRGEATDTRSWTTLGEALGLKKVEVREKAEAEVDSLEIVNRSDRWLFVQAGDVVRGGRQDRAARSDLIVRPWSEAQPLPAFCVEEGRWVEREGRGFTENTGILSGSVTRRVVQSGKQESVWNEVSRRVDAAQGRGPRPAPSRDPNESITAFTHSGTGTYNAVFDEKSVRAAAADAVAALASRVEGADALGIVAAVNGALATADVYASPELFAKLAAKLIESCAIDAHLARAGSMAELPDAAAVMAFVEARGATAGPAQVVAKGTNCRVSESAGVTRFDYGDDDCESVHRNCLGK